MLEWRVAVGDSVNEGDTVIEVSTDKIDAEVPAPTAGTITKLLVEPDDVVKVGQPLAEMAAGAAAPVGPSQVQRHQAEAPAASEAAAVDGDGTCIAGGPARRGRAGRRPRLGPGLGRRRQDREGRRPRRRGERRGSGRGARARRRGEAAARPRGDAREGDGREPQDADGDLVPHAPRRHPRRQAQGDQRAAEGARDQGLVHAPDRLGDRAGGDRVAGDGPHLRGARRQAVRDRGRPGQPRHRRGRREEGRLARADGPLHQGVGHARLRRASTPTTRT